MAELPTFRGYVDQRFIVEPLGGPRQPTHYTDRFPDELYHKAPESHLIRFLYALVGPAGVGWLREQTFDARLAFEQEGLELFDLDRFYGQPFKFGRIVEEVYEEDPQGVLPRQEWDKIRLADERYRARALDFLNAARAGTTPLGIELAARSGLGHEVEVIENYKHLFDSHSDDPLGLKYYGKTRSTQEIIVIPRREESRSERQKITVTGNPTGGTVSFIFKGQESAPVPYNAEYWEVQEALENLNSIGADNVFVQGGPGATNPWTIRFQNLLSNQDVPRIEVYPDLTGGTKPNVIVETVQQGIGSAADEIAYIPAKDQRSLQIAIDRLKPVTAIPTLNAGAGLRQHQQWNTIHSSSEYNEVVRYVTGSAKVRWPAVDNVNWIEPLKEKEARRSAKDLQYHYVGFHSVQEATSSSSHIGRFSGRQQRLLPSFDYLRQNKDDELVFGPDRVMADYFEPLVVSTQTRSPRPTQLINGIYPAHYSTLPGVPSLKYREEQFWASEEARRGSEHLILDLGQARAVNYLTFEVSRKPTTITVEYDVLDQEGRTKFVPVTPSNRHFTTSIIYNPEDRNPWGIAEFHFEDGAGHIPFTRYIKITFTREDFPALQSAGVQYGYSIEARNLRIGRNVSSY